MDYKLKEVWKLLKIYRSKEYTNIDKFYYSVVMNMLRLLVHIENKILLSDERKVLLLFDRDFNDISDWLHINYDVKLIKTDTLTVKDVVIVFATKDEFFEGRTVSVAKAISYLDSAERDVKKYLCDLNAKGSIKLQYGLRDGRVVHISEINKNERGLQCNCYCPGCGEKLVARLGEKKQKHFSHCGEHCNLESAQQTALHIMAKEIIEEELSLYVPGIKFEREEIYNNRGDELFWELPKEYEYKQGGMVKFDSVELEKKITDIVPDIVVYKNGRPCLIEIAVTHFVDDEKLLKVKRLNIPMFEINISSLHGSAFNKEQLREAIIKQKDTKKWIYNPQYESGRKEAKEHYSQRYTELKREKLRKEEVERKKALKREKNIQCAQNKIIELLKPENYKNELVSLRNDEAFNEFYKTLRFSKETKGDYPFFIDLPIRGEMIFNCDRRIWQGAIFDRFVYCCRSANGKKPIISYENIKRWIKEMQKTITINQEINRLVKIDGIEQAFLYEVLKQYLKYLSYLGFLSDLQSNKHLYRVEMSGSVIPPKALETEVLKRAINEADRYSPNINSEIENVIYFQEYVEIIDDMDETYSYVNPFYNSVINKEKRKLEEKNELVKGYETIKDRDFSLEEIIYDEFGTRWVKCTLCGKIKPSHMMSSYKFALGECSKCSEDAF